MTTLADLCVEAPAPSALDWNDTGVVYYGKLMQEARLQMYERAFVAEHGKSLEGWPPGANYMTCPYLLNLCCDIVLQEKMRQLVGENVGVHLNLTRWISNERDWHQDVYLNPPEVDDRYVAAWIALEDIHPDSGPFQYVPGSHRWPYVTRAKILAALEPEERGPDWPKTSERILSPLFEEEIKRRGAEVVTYLPKRGDVLLWHPRLLHRGSMPVDRTRSRKAIIAHFSGVKHREDMPPAIRYSGGWYFPIGAKKALGT